MGKGRRRPCLSKAIVTGPNAFSKTDSEILQPAAAPGRKRLSKTIATVFDSTRTTSPDDRDAEGRDAAWRFQTAGIARKGGDMRGFSVRERGRFRGKRTGLALEREQ